MNTTGERTRRGRGEGGWYIIGPLCGAAAAIAALLLSAYLLSVSLVPPSMLEDCALVSMFLGGAAAGIAAAKRSGRGVLTRGLGAGALLFIAALLAAWLSPSGRVLSAGCLKALICCVGGGLSGGAACLKRGRVKTHKRR